MVTASPGFPSVDVPDIAVLSWQHTIRRIIKVTHRILRHQQPRLLRTAVLTSCDVGDLLGFLPEPPISRMPSWSTNPQSSDQGGINILWELPTW